jgi:hypothetical protein
MALQLAKNGANGNGGTLSAVVDDFAWDYGYGSQPHHLDDEEMVERYESERRRNPSAIIAVDAQGCGHWAVQVYSTDIEKKLFYAKRISELLSNAIKLLTR